MLPLDGRVVAVTGAGQGLGRCYATLLAELGAAVVVNDLGVDLDGTVAASSGAQAVVDEIVARGGRAVADGNDISDPDGARRLVEVAVAELGDLHVLVNNAGIVRDRMLVNLSVEDWDAVVRVHLRGHFCTMSAAAAHWRSQAKAGATVDRSVINTTSTAGLFGYAGQSNYAAAKAGIVAMTQSAAKELARYHVRCNAIAPSGRTRMTESGAATAAVVAAPEDEGAFDTYDPANNAPLVAALAAEGCPITGEVFNVVGTKVIRLAPWQRAEELDRPVDWTVPDLVEALVAALPH